MQRGSSAEDRAADWHARLCADDCSAADRRAFERWLAADPAHDAAWRRVGQAGRRMDALAGDPAMRRLVEQARAARPAMPPPARREPARRYLRPLAIAASVALAIGLGGLLALDGGMPGLGRGASVAEGESFANTDTAPQLIRLDDGSRVQLAAASRLSVRPGSGGRTLTLQAGQADFTVARDPAHPFTVTAAGYVVTALGTRFSVDLAEAEGRSRFALHEGSVEIRRLDDGQRWRLEPGMVLDVSGGVAALLPAAPRLLTFDGAPLEQVVAQVNRAGTAMLVLDPALAERPFSGSLQADGADALVEALEAYGIARAQRRTDGAIVLAPNR